MTLFAVLSVQPALAASEKTADRATLAGLVPHKALYDITLVSNSNSSHFQNLSGQMFYQWQPGCEAWLSNHRFNMVYEYIDVPAMRITSDYSTYEPFDGKSMTFTSQRRRDGELFEETRGSAQLGSDEKRPEAVFTIPEGLSFALSENTLFPMAHTLEVLDQIRAGKKFFRSTIFDGSDKEGPMQVTTFVGKPVETAELLNVAAGIDDKLLRGKAWNIRLAFFPLNTDDPGSDYEMSVVFHENGIIGDITIEYHDFSVSQKLVALENMENACNAKDGKKQETRKEAPVKPDHSVKKP